eukprot:1145525-Pelagomonas_calceolata.AAC.2
MLRESTALGIGNFLAGPGLGIVVGIGCHQLTACWHSFWAQTYPFMLQLTYPRRWMKGLLSFSLLDLSSLPTCRAPLSLNFMVGSYTRKGKEKVKENYVGIEALPTSIKEKGLRWCTEKKRKSTPAKRPRALRKGSLTSKLEKVSPKGPQD